MWSWLILIGRGLNQEVKGVQGRRKEGLLFSFECSDEDSKKERSGSDSMMETPVPIPNTEVKHHNGDDSEQLQQ